MSASSMARLLADRLEAEGESAGAEITVEGLLEEWAPYGVARSSLELTTKSEYDLLVLEFLADRRLTVLDDPAVAEAAAEELDTPEPGLEPLEEHADVTLRLDLATISGGYRGSEADPGSVPDAGPGPESGPREETVPPTIGDESGTGEDADSGAGSGALSDAESGEGGGDEDDGGDASGAVEAWDPTGGVDARPTRDAGGEADSGPASGGSDRSEGSDRPVDIGSARGGRSGEEESGAGPDAECRSCGEALPVDVDVPVRFCPSCGAARPERACPECGARLRPEWSYCPACGTHASPSGGVPGSGPDGVDAGEWEPE